MWRESVYSTNDRYDVQHQPLRSYARNVVMGTLRPKQTDEITAATLDKLLEQLAFGRNCNDFTTSLSNIHSINRIDNGLYLGDKYAAKDKRFLTQNGITHVLNCAEGCDEYQVNTNENYYREAKIKYFGIPGHDRPSWNISVYFEQAARFIESAINGGGRVLIHCVVGISRSATIVIAYLMITRGMNASEALQFVFRRRRVFPNPGFLHHLAQFNNVLAKRRGFMTNRSALGCSYC